LPIPHPARSSENITQNIEDKQRVLSNLI